MKKTLIDTYNTATQNESGGVQVKIMQYYSELKKRGYDVTLFNKWEHKIIDYDILHIFKVTLDSYELIRFAKNNDIPVVISSIIPLDNEIKIKVSNYLEKINIHTPYSFLKKQLELSDAVIAETYLEKIFIEKNYGIKNVNVIPNGITINLDKSLANIFPERTGIRGKYVLQVGRFEPNKNQLSLIKAFRNTNVQVVFIGGPARNELNYYEECKKLSSENIYFLGWVDHNDPLLASAYMNAQVVVLPSFNEIYGNSLLEGGAAGANLVATKVLPIESWGIEKYCWILDPNSIDSIKTNVLAAYNSPKNNNLVEKIHQLFSWDEVIAKHIEIYKAIW